LDSFEKFLAKFIRRKDRELTDEEYESLDYIQTLIVARINASDESCVIRGQAAEMLSGVGDWSDRHRLRTLLADPEWPVRSDATRAVRQIFGRRAKRTLLKMLEDSERVVRREAAGELGFFGDTSVIPILEAKLETEQTNQARGGLFFALIRLGRREYWPQFLALHSITYEAANCVMWRFLPDLLNHEPLSNQEKLALRETIANARTLGYAEDDLLKDVDEAERLLEQTA